MARSFLSLIFGHDSDSDVFGDALRTNELVDSEARQHGELATSRTPTAQNATIPHKSKKNQTRVERHNHHHEPKHRVHHSSSSSASPVESSVIATFVVAVAAMLLFSVSF